MIAGIYCEFTRQNWVSANRFLQIQYNADNKPVKELYYESDGTTDNLLFAVNYVYDTNGNVVKIYQTAS